MYFVYKEACVQLLDDVVKLLHWSHRKISSSLQTSFLPKNITWSSTFFFFLTFAQLHFSFWSKVFKLPSLTLGFSAVCVNNYLRQRSKRIKQTNYVSPSENLKSFFRNCFANKNWHFTLASRGHVDPTKVLTWSDNSDARKSGVIRYMQNVTADRHYAFMSLFTIRFHFSTIWLMSRPFFW